MFLLEETLRRQYGNSARVSVIRLLGFSIEFDDTAAEVRTTKVRPSGTGSGACLTDVRDVMDANLPMLKRCKAYPPVI